MQKFYAGIGSKKTPADILNFMTSISKKLKDRYTLRSGGVKGADKAFEIGADSKEIFRPEHATQEAINFVSSLHPNWNACSEYVRKLHGRNAQILLGKDLDSPVDFVLCWTPNAKLVGGTAMGIKIARLKNIPVFNFADQDQIDSFKDKYLNWS